MTLTNLDKAPFPYFGGKRKAAPLVWSLLGDVDHYVEPFFGSGAVLLERPHQANRAYHSETVNDAEGMVVNFWRAVQWHPEATAEAASWPVAELDKQARQITLQRWAHQGAAERLAGDPLWCDPVMAGWWAWAVSVQIGAIGGPWVADPVSGRIVKRSTLDEPGVRRDRPHLTSNGQGVNRPQTREPGVSRDRPHLGDNGRGVNRPQTREPGVSRDLPHLGNDGKGVNRPQTREPGVRRDLPQLGDNGRGVNHAGTREPGVRRSLPHLTGNGKGVHHAGTREPGVLDVPTVDSTRSRLDATDWGAAYHDLTMPELIRWFRHLAARLRHVRVLCGDWSRACTSGAAKTLPVRMGGHAGIFLDPPYADTADRADNLYTTDSLDVAHRVREWCIRNGGDPRYRIVLAGFDGEHGTALVDAGWAEHEWFSAGFLSGGMGNLGGSDAHQQHRERLWSSPHCLALAPGDDGEQLDLFGEAS